jgi:F-box-like
MLPSFDLLNAISPQFAGWLRSDKKTLRKNNLPGLPPEMWLEIFKHLAPKQIVNNRLICREWKLLSDLNSLWKFKIQECFGSLGNVQTLNDNAKDRFQNLLNLEKINSMAKGREIMSPLDDFQFDDFYYGTTWQNKYG